ncbi:MAG: hypothetical protein WBA41_23840 [Rivularia sp. (in: cyanobacteria)]
MSRNYKKGRYSNKQQPCPVCGNTKGSCKINDDGSIYCFHSTPNSVPSGYVHVRELSDGMGHSFISSYVVDELLTAAKTLQSQGKRTSCKEISDLTRRPSSWAIAVQKAYPSHFSQSNKLNAHHCATLRETRKQNNQPPPTDKENVSFSSVLSEEERDKQYRSILNQLPLNETHLHHLTDVRGLGEFIDFIGFRSWSEKRVENVSYNLPGVVEHENSLCLYKPEGIFLPIHNELGQIIAFQIRPDDTSSGKYKWGSSAPKGGNGPRRLDNGEMPLAFCRPESIELPSIGLAEGVLKAWSVACNLKQIIIGASGAAWDCSPKLFKRYLEKAATEQNTSLSELVIDLYVDAGMLSNQHIMLRYHETIKLLQEW